MDIKVSLLLTTLMATFSFSALAEEAAATKPAANPMTLTTNAFLDQGSLPVLYTCDGKDISPQLSWDGAPDKTQSYALIFSDLNAPKGNFYHWVIYNVPKSVTTLPQAMDKAPSGSLLGKNSWEKEKYNGPCPPKGDSHTYVFRLYALDTKLTLPKGADATTVLQAMDKHILGKVDLSAVYSRWIN
jgi:Raf kinase inhibitor-like YbhB/YbcL family protein